MFKKILLSFSLLLLAAPAFSAEPPSNKEIVRLTRYVGENLTGVSASFIFQVELISSQETKAIVELPMELEPYLVFEKRGSGTIVVDMRIPKEVNKKIERERDYWNRNKLVLKLYTPTLNYIGLTTATKAKASGEFSSSSLEIKMDAASKLYDLKVNANELTVKLSGAAKATVEAFAPTTRLQIDGAGKLEMNLSGNKKTAMNISSAGNVNLAGEGETVIIDASSAAKINTLQFRAKHVEVTASSAAKADVYASDYLKIRTSSAAKVQYSGSPKQLDVVHPNISPIR